MFLAPLSLLMVSSITAIKPQVPQYSVLKKIKIGSEGGWDYLTVDSNSHRLFISRGTHVMVMDTVTGRLVGDIPNTPGVHGIALATKLGKGYTSNGRDNSVTVFDLKSLKPLARISVGSNPDAILYDAFTKKVLTFNGRSSDVSVIDAVAGKVVGTIKVAGKPEFPASDGKGMVYVNIEDQNLVEKLNINKLASVAKMPITPGEEPSGLAFDLKAGLIYSTCHNNMMTVLNIKTGKVVGTPKIGDGPDAAAFDPKQNLAFSSNGQDGTITVIQGTRVVQTLKTQKSARTMTLDPKTHLIYLICADTQPSDNTSGRPKMVPGSAAILVVGPK